MSRKLDTATETKKEDHRKKYSTEKSNDKTKRDEKNRVSRSTTPIKTPKDSKNTTILSRKSGGKNSVSEISQFIPDISKIENTEIIESKNFLNPEDQSPKHIINEFLQDDDDIDDINS